MQAGAMVDMTHQWLGETDAYWAGSKNRWEFPAGSTLSFGYLDAPFDWQNYMGTEYQFIGFDEITTIREKDYTELFSRLVRISDATAESPDGLTISEVPLRARSTSNPGGKYHEWVHKRFVKADSRKPEIVFMPSLLDDNPHVDAETYKQSLAELDPIRRKQLLEGDWEVKSEGAIFRNEPEIVDEPFGTNVRRARFWDLAATAQTTASPDPDYTAGVLLARSKDGLWRIEDIQRFRRDPAGVEKAVRTTADTDGKAVPIVIEAAGSGWKPLFDHYARNILPGFQTYKFVPKGSKEVRASALAAAWNNGHVSIRSGPNTSAAINELLAFPYGDHDDVVDACSGAHLWLSESAPMQIQSPADLTF